MKFLKAIGRRVASEPLVTFGVIVAGLNAATTQTWAGYAGAVAVALLRFAVSPVVSPTPPVPPSDGTAP